ncbi:MAG: hypothetical protein CJD30_02230 [Sulfuricurvum sp. PD_MW2]|uniref:hypothetical protein n=1 Tax=Sulfuricurvum sp. PD_MW2 TaxID=2027917 RepID=UPI000C061FC8|nr:hypothetical protein [Sulfuricurvum sp. PD_MW2]PHM18268.1 MAG: hypothetical protein CJD30_02230 [Sulfuricurvum sp. PD_MW2]
MKQCNTFEDLQALGIEKVHEQTHISRDKLELVMGKAYGEIGRVQFMGYISILEREYGIDLNGIKEEYKAFYNDNADMMAPKPSVILQATSNSKPKWVVAGIGLIALLIVGGYILQGKLTTAPQEDVMHLTTAAVEVVDQNSDVNVTDRNETNTSAVTVAAPEVVPVPAPDMNKSVKPAKTLVSAKELSILPKYKVWYGIIDVASGEKTQGVTKDPITIDTAKNLLIVMGHGRVEITYPDGKTQLDDRNTVYFTSEQGAMKQISHKEFLERNGGKGW